MPRHGLVVSRMDGSNRLQLTPSGHIGKEEERERGREGGVDEVGWCLKRERGWGGG